MDKMRVHFIDGTHLDVNGIDYEDFLKKVDFNLKAIIFNGGIVIVDKIKWIEKK